MKKTINKLFLYSLISVLSSNAIAADISERAPTQIVDYAILSDSTPYKLALENGIDFNELNRINDMKLKPDDVLSKGQTIKLPSSSKMVQASISKASGETNTSEISSILPNLGDGVGLGSEPSTIVNEALNYTGVSPFVSGSSEENASKLAVAAASTDWEQLSIEKLADDTLTRLENDAKNKVTSAVSGKVENFLGKFGKAEVVLSVDDKGNLAGSSLNVLSPLFDEGQNLIFSQVGVHGQGSGDDSRTIGNFGLGYRYETSEWLAGGNAFIDHDFSGSNTRLGLGAEYWRDYLKLATNFYTPLSSWKESSVMKNYEALVYDERPAQGFDIRANAYLPNYPQIGGSLVFEQYYGDEVALFGTDERQIDPYAMTVGLNYTPIPLITTELTHKMGKSGAEDSRLNVNLNLQLGTPLEQQLDPNNVNTARSLKGSRYDMVDRNYDIVFEYKKEDFQIAISGPNEAIVGEDVMFDSSIQSRSPIQSYEWIVSDLVGNSINIPNNQSKSVMFKIQNNFDHYVRLKVVTERGYEAVSEPKLIKVISAQSQSVLFNNDGDNVRKRMIDFNSINLPFYDDAFDLPKNDRHELTFIAKDSAGNDFDLNQYPNLEFSWRLNGARSFSTIELDDGMVKIFSTPGDAANKRNLVVVADEKLLTSLTAGTASIDIAVSSKDNLTVFAMTTLEFYKGDVSALKINPSNVKIKILKTASTRSNADDAERLMSISGIENNQPIINVGYAPLSQGANYQAQILTKQNGSDDWVDVTDIFVDSMVWLYWDPTTGREISTSEPIAAGNGNKYRALEGCISSNNFVTQTNNYLNNELAFGEILQEDLLAANSGISKRTLTEQGLRLAVQFDYTKPNQPKNLSETECKLNELAAKDYAGRDGDNFKATAWIGN